MTTRAQKKISKMSKQELNLEMGRLELDGLSASKRYEQIVTAGFYYGWKKWYRRTL